MKGWTVSIEVAGEPTGYDLQPGLEELVDHLAPYGAAVSASPDGSRYSVTLSIEGIETCPDAIRVALTQYVQYRDKAGLPPWHPVRIEAMTFDEHDRQLAQPAYPELVGIAEIAAMFHVARQRASELRTRRGFPKPVANLRAGPVWIKSQVEHFAQTWDRKPGRPVSSGLPTAR